MKELSFHLLYMLDITRKRTFTDITREAFSCISTLSGSSSVDVILLCVKMIVYGDDISDKWVSMRRVGIQLSTRQNRYNGKLKVTTPFLPACVRLPSVTTSLPWILSKMKLKTKL